jgi:hypothetical protein
MRSIMKNEEEAILTLIDKIPSERIPNYAFHNNGDLTFSNYAETWGLATPSHSNGAAYGDLDNDGDLDLVVNNVNMPPFIYRNNTREMGQANFLTLAFTGTGRNSAAVGATATLYFQGRISYQELIPARGFKSSMESRLHFGLADVNTVDSMRIGWPDGSCTWFYDVPANQSVTLSHPDAQTCPSAPPAKIKTFITRSDPPEGLDFRHVENDFNDFRRESLLFLMNSNEGPRMTVGDVNGDSRDDLYICGAKGSAGALYVQGDRGFTQTNRELFNADSTSEETDCLFFDADSDGDLDLYVACGGSELSSSSSSLADRLYLNNGQGTFRKSRQILPGGRYESSSCVQSADFDGDGDLDLFVGIRLRPFLYGVPADGFLLENDGTGNFHSVAEEKAPGLKEIGMITDMVWADVDGDQDPDMVIVGDWMPVKIFVNEGGRFTDRSGSYGLTGTEGWWHRVAAGDLDGDGDMDLVLGNHGLNSRFHASAIRPISMYVNDFDRNGNVEQIICAFNGDTSYPVAMKDDLVRQIPALGGVYETFESYSGQTIKDIFSEDILQSSVVLEAHMLESVLLIHGSGESFSIRPLPATGQLFPIYSIETGDFNHDHVTDILIGGNMTRAKPETGIYSAGHGLFLEGRTGGNWYAVPPDSSGFFSRGEIRDIKTIEIRGKPEIAVARNNQNLHFYTF